MSRESRRPVTVVSGFLGTGKTTLLRHALGAGSPDAVAVIVNEFGAVGLDHDLLRHVGEWRVLVGGGCACCERREDLVRALRELLDLDQRGEIPRLDRVVIETSGLADPAPILFTIATDPLLQHHFTVEGVVVAVDGLNGEMQLDRRPESLKQALVADRLVVTKADVAEPEAVARLEARLRDVNPTAEVVRTGLDAPPGPELLRFDGGRVREVPPVAGGGHGDVGQLSLRFERPLDWVAFSVWLSMLLHAHGERVLRVKGVLDVEDVGPVSVNGVQHVLHRPEHLDGWPDGERSSRLVLIVSGLDTGLVARSLDTFQSMSGGTR
jgi:G3E family GTPase